MTKINNTRSKRSTKKYIRCFKTKNKAPFYRDEVYIISFNVSVFHSSFLALASAYKDASFFVTESKWRT